MVFLFLVGCAKGEPCSDGATLACFLGSTCWTVDASSDQREEGAAYVRRACSQVGGIAGDGHCPEPAPPLGEAFICTVAVEVGNDCGPADIVAHFPVDAEADAEAEAEAACAQLDGTLYRPPPIDT